jgi:CRISPR-associated endonuclease Csn1
MPESGKYGLGFDVGVQSVGWALMQLDRQGTPNAIVRAGVRCFECNVGTERDIEQGRDEPPGKKRRDARQQRRQTARRARRVRKVFGILQRSGFLPQSDSIDDSVARDKMLKALDIELAAEYVPAGDRAAAHVMPYRLRAAALDGPLPPFALGRAFYHLAQRRGFLSNRKATKQEAASRTLPPG